MTDLDNLLHEAMRAARGPVAARPSVLDVRRRARRRNRRRMTAMAGAVGMVGAAGVAGLAASGHQGSRQVALNDSTGAAASTAAVSTEATTATTSSATATSAASAVPVTTQQAVVLIDAGAPAGAMDDARQRLQAFDVFTIAPVRPNSADSQIVPLDPAGIKTVHWIESFMNFTSTSSLDPALLANVPDDAIAAIVIGPDYWTAAGTAAP